MHCFVNYIYVLQIVADAYKRSTLNIYSTRKALTILEISNSLKQQTHLIQQDKNTAYIQKLTSEIISCLGKFHTTGSDVIQ